MLRHSPRGDGCFLCAEKKIETRDLRSTAPPGTLPPAMEVKLKYRGQLITDTDVASIRAFIAENPDASRNALGQDNRQAST